jgi:hypothetical protein
MKKKTKDKIWKVLVGFVALTTILFLLAPFATYF